MSRVCRDCGKVISDKKWRRHLRRCGYVQFRKVLIKDIKKARKNARRNQDDADNNEAIGGVPGSVAE